MADHLAVDTGGLTTGANSSAAIAVSLAAGLVDGGGGPGSRPSQAGVSAVDGALSTMRRTQAGRTGEQARNMSAASTRYAETDTQSAGAVAELMWPGCFTGADRSRSDAVGDTGLGYAALGPRGNALAGLSR